MGKFLSNARSGKRLSPLSVVLYGTEGIGKSTFAAEAPNSILLIEPGGGDEIEPGKKIDTCKSWGDVLEAVDELRNEDHDHRSLAIDTLDWIEPLIWAFICQRDRKENIEAYGYNKGPTIAIEEWRKLLARLEDLRDRKGMNIIVTAHANVRTFNNPAGDNYDRNQMKLDVKAAALFREWSMATLFAEYEVFTKKKTEKDLKAKAFGEGARVVRTEKRPAYDAKNRYGLPHTMPLSWAEFESAARKGVSEKPVDLTEQIKEVLGSVDATVKAQGEGSLARCGSDPNKLAKLLDWLRSKANATEAA